MFDSVQNLLRAFYIPIICLSDDKSITHNKKETVITKDSKPQEISVINPTLGSPQA